MKSDQQPNFRSVRDECGICEHDTSPVWGSGLSRSRSGSFQASVGSNAAADSKTLSSAASEGYAWHKIQAGN